MGDEVERLLVRVEANADQFDRAMKKLNGTLNSVEVQNRRTFARMKKEAEQAGRELGEMVGNGIKTASAVSTVALLGISAYAIKLASDAAEIRNAFDTAFGESAKSARTFANVLSDEVGRDSVQVEQAMSRLQLVIKGTGVEAQQSAELVKALTARAVDVGSLFNVEDSEAFASFISGITGEAEPLKKFGVVLTEAAVKAELLRLGFKGNTEQASEAAKSIARANLILEKTSIAQGDAAKTADGTANSAKRMKAEFNAAARDLGEQLLPFVTEAIHKVTDLTKTFSDMPDGVQIAGLGILAFIAAGGPIAGLLANISKVIELASKARVALIGMTGASGAAGGAGLAGAAGGAALFGAPVAVAGAGAFALGINSQKTKQYQGVLASPQKASDDDLQAALFFAQTNYNNRVRENSRVEAGKRQRAEFGAALQKLRAEEARRKTASPASVTGDAKPVGGFTLSPDLMKPATATAKKSTSAAAADKTAREAEAARQKANAQEERTLSAIQSAREDEYRAVLELATTQEERSKLELEALDRRRQSEKDGLKLDVQQKQITQAQADEIEAAQQSAYLAQRKVLEAEEGERKRRDAQSIADAALATQIDLAQASVGLAETAKDRQTAELRLLDLQFQEERSRQEAVLASKDSTEAEKQIARERLKALGALKAAATQGVAQSNRGPGESYLASLQDGGSMGEQLQVNALQAFNDGLVDAIMNSKSLGDVFHAVAQQIVADLVKIAIQQTITKPLAEALFSNSGGGGETGSGNWITAAFSAFSKAYSGPHAAGGAMASGQWGTVGEKGMEAVYAKPGGGIQVMSNGALRAMQAQKAPAARAGYIVVEGPRYTLNSPVVTADLVKQMEAITRQSEQRAVGRAVELSRRGAPQVQARLNMLGTP